MTVKEVVGEDGEPDLLLSMDRTKIKSVGKPALGAFLQKLQVENYLFIHKSIKMQKNESK